MPAGVFALAANVLEVAAAADKEQVRRVSVGEPSEETKDRLRKLSVDAAAASPAKAEKSED